MGRYCSKAFEKRDLVSLREQVNSKSAYHRTVLRSFAAQHNGKATDFQQPNRLSTRNDTAAHIELSNYII
jgi:hypothetical protein